MLSVTTLAATYLICTLKTRYHRVLYGVFKTFIVWLSLKTFRSKFGVIYRPPLPSSFPDEQWLLFNSKDVYS